MADAVAPLAWTIGRILTWSVDYLRAKGLTESPRLDAELLLGHALKLARIQLYTQYDKPLNAAEREPFKAFLQRRSRGEPVAYITGEKEFMGYRFEVSPAVLIPRPDTELLVELILEWSKASSPEQLRTWRILDVGTGSGCIATSLALKLASSQVHVSAWDFDMPALANAKANAQRLGANVDFSQRDALAASSWDSAAAEPYDMIVSNPPYIAPAEGPDLPSSVVAFEPQQALFAPPDGLCFYRALTAFAGHLLKPGGHLVVEIGSTQAAAVQQLFAEAGWQQMTLHKDWSRLDRVVSAIRPGHF